MSTSSEVDLTNALPQSYILPDQFDPIYTNRLIQYLEDMGSAVNLKENGFYFTEETPISTTFVPNYGTTSSANVEFRTLFRTVVDFGALPNSTTKSVAHGISTTEDFKIIKISGASTDPGASTITAALPLPYVGTNSIYVDMDATNVTVTTTSNRTSFTETFIIIEYIKI